MKKYTVRVYRPFKAMIHDIAIENALPCRDVVCMALKEGCFEFHPNFIGIICKGIKYEDCIPTIYNVPDYIITEINKIRAETRVPLYVLQNILIDLGVIGTIGDGRLINFTVEEWENGRDQI